MENKTRHNCEMAATQTGGSYTVVKASCHSCDAYKNQVSYLLA